MWKLLVTSDGHLITGQARFVEGGGRGDARGASAQIAKLFELAKEAFEREALADPALQARARASAERSIRALLVTLGFKEVVFVQQQPLAPPR